MALSEVEVTVGRIRFEMHVEVSDREIETLIAYLNSGEFVGLEACWGGFDIPNDSLLITLDEGMQMPRVLELVDNWLAAHHHLQNI